MYWSRQQCLKVNLKVFFSPEMTRVLCIPFCEFNLSDTILLYILTYFNEKTLQWNVWCCQGKTFLHVRQHSSPLVVYLFWASGHKNHRIKQTLEVSAGCGLYNSWFYCPTQCGKPTTNGSSVSDVSCSVKWRLFQVWKMASSVIQYFS